MPRRGAIPLAASECGLAHPWRSVCIVAGNDKPGAAGRVGCAVKGIGARVILVQRRIEVKDVPVLFGESAIPVVAHAGGNAQVGRHLELVLSEEPGFIGAVVAVGIAL